MLGSPLKKQPAFGYHQAMYRAVLTLLVGLMLSLGGGRVLSVCPTMMKPFVRAQLPELASLEFKVNLLYVEEAVKRDIGLWCW